MSTWAVILCAGRSTRMGLGQNKTLLPLHGSPVFTHSMRAFRPFVDGILLVTGEAEQPAFRAACEQYACPADAFAFGGKERRDSVLNALRALPEDCGQVLIHDGARCFITGDVIRRVLDSVLQHGSGVAAIPARDTIKEADPDEQVVRTFDRARLRVIQTPQGFRLKELLHAYDVCGDMPATDDASLMEQAGYPVRLVQGDEANLKLTYKEDLAAVNNRVPRIGQGYDAHCLVEGRPLILCGENIPYEKGLLGHSDADVAVHALMDALLGAAALGDIGHLFPDNDDRYKGISSMLLLREVARVIRENGFAFVNCDITIIAQRPKLAPFIEAMRANVAAVLQTDVRNIAVKATTTEKMGFEGRGEGISALAVAMLLSD